jgi:hypothetical protein
MAAVMLSDSAIARCIEFLSPALHTGPHDCSQLARHTTDTALSSASIM